MHTNGLDVGDRLLLLKPDQVWVNFCFSVWVGGNSSEDKQFLMYNVNNGVVGDGGPHQMMVLLQGEHRDKGGKDLSASLALYLGRFGYDKESDQ